MKLGMTMQELATEVMRMNEVKVDYLVPARAMQVRAEEGIHRLEGVTDAGFPMQEMAHEQLGIFLGIPRPYYQRIRSDFPDLLDVNANRLLAAKGDERRMVRTLDGQARAVLSKRYRRLDNAQLLEHLLPVLQDVPGLQMGSCNITERNLYLKVTFDSLQGEVKVGDVVRMGALIKNSEVGASRFIIAPFSERLWCRNGATHEELGQARNHVGRGLMDGDEDYSIYSDATLEADDHAFWLKCRDSLKAALSESTFKHLLNQMKEAAGIEIPTPPQAAVEVLTNRIGLAEKEGQSVLQHLIAGGDLSLWGYANAVTRTAADATSYDRASDLEFAGGKLMALRGTDLKATFSSN
jgi:hypothetical protein